ncbi:putative transmembrane protein [Gregarina niphandrodes]|uniref:Transmembrane protein n=1 Tax=Gregarina niphandrodes TaxID=110365 RepID=A0A023BBC8_GRENI|nr:putative transmembrane protein [Gregarina niphandrodes]EZG79051.1 putative transmembrane protein [Gregarina niphandrodes]|eukprot:XP_011129135.1 putative transmembrane protein [Gregarina niphandrodes]
MTNYTAEKQVWMEKIEIEEVVTGDLQPLRIVREIIAIVGVITIGMIAAGTMGIMAMIVIMGTTSTIATAGIMAQMAMGVVMPTEVGI